ncbi:hypothetical protein ACQKWADRAFT_315430 [Trichoderma austrokoningii]
MCIVNQITFSCTHIENTYVSECGTRRNRCAKQINRSASASACQKCLETNTPLERYRKIVDYYENIKYYLMSSFQLTNVYDRDILRSQVKYIAEVMEEEKAHALDKLQRRLEAEAQRRERYSEVDGSEWV